MASTSVEYYEKLNHLQEIQRDSEDKRLHLEKELNSYVRSDQRLSKLRAARLQNYWKKICEDEKKSRWRNEQLLKDFDRVESQIAMLNTRTQKLRDMKRQYEEHIERMYPQWKEKAVMRKHMPTAEAASARTSTPIRPASNLGINPEPRNFATYKISTNDAFHQQVEAASAHIPSQPAPHIAETLNMTAANSTMQTISSLQTGVSLTATQEGLLKAYSTASAMGNTLDTTDFGSLHHETQPPDTPTVTNTTVKKPVTASPRAEELDTWRSDVSQHTPQAGHVSSQHSVPSHHSERPSAANETLGEDIEEFGDDELSARDASSARAQTASPERPASRSLMASPSVEMSKSEVYPEADVTLEGLYNMLTAIQEALPTMRNRDDLYTAQTPALSVRKDIIQNANKGAMLSHVDPNSISMVVLEQLPLVVTNCENACLLPDKMLFSPPAFVSESSINSQVHPASREFWKKLYDHFVLLIKYRAMTAVEIADRFAVLLIAEDSPYEEKAKGVLERLLDEIEAGDGLTSPNSTATLSSMQASPRKEVERQPSHEQVSPQAEEEASPGKDDDDDFFSQPTPQAGSMGLQMGSLTQSLAYKRMLGETGSTQKTISYEDSDADSSSEDDIEKALSMGGSSKRETARSEAPAAAVEEKSSPSPPPSPTPAYVPSAIEQPAKSPMSTLTSTGKSAKKKNPAFMYGDSDTEEDVEVPGTAGNDDASKRSMDDDFEFYG